SCALASGRRGRPRRHAEQVRPQRRPALMSDRRSPMIPSARVVGSGGERAEGRSAEERNPGANRRVLFVTGKLAEPSLRRVLTDMAPPFAYDISVLGITVAALMTTAWIARVLEVPDGTDLVLIPGLCEGDPQLI